MTSPLRVRFAPSPTGFLHVGSFRTALFNWLFARKNAGDFILRIEDTDRQRSTDEFLKSQLSDLQWMGLDWDEGPLVGGDYGPYFQMGRLHTYEKHARILLKENKAYHCYCTAEELKNEREEAEKSGGSSGYGGRCRNLSDEEKDRLKEEGRKPCIRFRSPEEGEVIVDDLIKGQVSFDCGVLDDFVIVKSDGIPTYNFAVVVDDYTMGISHVIRGDEHMSNTPRQALLFDAFGYKRPIFCHIPIILNEDKTKLSKRKGAVNLLDYRDRGYLKEALFNFLALLGWAPKDNREIMTPDEMIEAFSLDGIPRHPAVFDEKKLQWMNSQYLKQMKPEDLASVLMDYFRRKGVTTGGRDEKWLQKAVEIYRERMKTLEDFIPALGCYFGPLAGYEPQGVKKAFRDDFMGPALLELADRIDKMDDFSEALLESLVRNYAEELGVSAGKLIQGIRLSATGMTATPPIFDVMALMGREILIQRLKEGARFIEENRPGSEVSAS